MTFLKGTIKKISGQEGEHFLNFLGLLKRAGLTLMKSVLTPLANSVLMSLKSTAAASAIDAAVQKKIFCSGMVNIYISNKDLNDTMKMVKPLEDGFLGILVVTLGASLLGNMLAGKGVVRGGDE